MSTCKDCLYYDLCKSAIMDSAIVRRLMLNGSVMLEEAKEQVMEEYYSSCNHFKDRSKFIDVSELQQNVIRPLTNRCAEYTKCQTCLACALEIRERCEHYKKTDKQKKL